MGYFSACATVQETHAKHVLHAENPCGFGYFTGFLLSQE